MLEEEQQNQVAQLIVAKNLSVRETEKLVERVKAGKAATESVPSNEPIAFQYQEQVNNLARQLQTSIKLKPGKAGKGSLVIQYDGVHDLQKIMEQLLG